ncbi:hypothetical protein B0A48_09535 [Cryoendolithus antarcticus]|uniref:Uncharacterized protein n=1 Tax=Cryoendolithus antarcticus TaxID=1507870 RepID=A0A1V8SZM1_9PEZI|nr:hypothetical protein B0A48_09535 [Cryoendolithus antarcticus]
MPYDYEIAKAALSEADKNRILCLYLNCDAKAINWEKATKDFGCASVDSMKVMARTALKKIETAGGKLDDAGTAVAGAGTPAKVKRGRKSKAKDDVDGAGDDDEETPKKRVKTKEKSKKVKNVEEGEECEESGDGAGEGVKVEQDGDE